MGMYLVSLSGLRITIMYARNTRGEHDSISKGTNLVSQYTVETIYIRHTNSVHLRLNQTFTSSHQAVTDEFTPQMRIQRP